MNEQPLDRCLQSRAMSDATRLFESFLPLVRSVCRRYLRDAQDVEDAVQETFLKLARHHDRLPQPIAPWLVSVARSTSIDLIRSALARRRRRSSMPSATENAPPGDEAAHCSRALIEHYVQRALFMVEDEARQLLIDRFFRGADSTAASRPPAGASPRR